MNWAYQGKEITSLKLRVSEDYQLSQKGVRELDEYLNGSEDTRNKLILGDNMYVLKALQRGFRNKIKLIYCDPPFFAGSVEILDIPMKISEDKTKRLRTAISSFGYRNILDNPRDLSSFVKWFRERCRLMKPLVTEDGFVAIRYDYHYGHYVKIILDDVFGRENFIIEFQVRRMIKNIAKKQLHTQTHVIVGTDIILLYRNSKKSQPNIESPHKVRRPRGLDFEYERADDNIWFDIIGYSKVKKTFYPTENSEILLKRLIKLCSTKGDWVADFFIGSGTTMAVAEKLGRRWIGVDVGNAAIHETKKRLLSLEPSAKFEVLELMENGESAKLKLPKKTTPPTLKLVTEVRGISATIQIKDYILPEAHLKTSGIIGEFKNPLNLIDYCAIDWNSNDQKLFTPTQVYFRRFKNKKVIKSIPSRLAHKYSNPGNYTILIKVIDILGNQIDHQQKIRISSK